MSTTSHVRGVRRFAATALLITGAVIGCTEEFTAPQPTGPGAQVGALRLTVGASPQQTVTVYSDGRITLGPISILRPGTSLTIELLDRVGAVIAANPAELEVKVGSTSPRNTTGSSGVVSYQRTDGFSGELITANNPGSTTLQVVLFDVVRRRNVFGPYPVPIVTR